MKKLFFLLLFCCPVFAQAQGFMSGDGCFQTALAAFIETAKLFPKTDGLTLITIFSFEVVQNGDLSAVAHVVYEFENLQTGVETFGSNVTWDIKPCSADVVFQ